MKALGTESLGWQGPALASGRACPLAGSLWIQAVVSLQVKTVFDSPLRCPGAASVDKNSSWVGRTAHAPELGVQLPTGLRGADLHVFSEHTRAAWSVCVCVPTVGPSPAPLPCPSVVVLQPPVYF